MRRGLTWAEMGNGLRPRRLRPMRRRDLGVGCEQLERRDCPAAMFSIEPPANPIIEGDRATFTVRLSEASSQPERVVISTVAETATLGRDYIFQNDQQLLFAPGVTSRQFTINTLSDSIREGIETLRIIATPSNRPAAQRIVSRASIYDFVPTSVSVSDIRVTEGNEGTTNADFTVRLTAGSLLPVTLQYATQDGTATAGTDYTTTSGTLTFNPGEFVKTVSVPILGDRVAETDETFKLLLSNPSRSTTIRTPQAICTIVNDERDAPGFQITVTYGTPNLTTAQKSVFERAVTRIQQIVVGDLPGFTMPDGTFIDDVKINAYVDPNTGEMVGNNGYAFATGFRPGNAGLAYEGEIHLNADFINRPGIYYTAIHEMLHVLGFSGNFFSATNTAAGLGTVTPLFTGTNAVREYNSYFGLASSPGVPLYGVIAAQGSYGSHWDTGTIGTEIMSVGWDTTSTAVRPFSRITIGALDDIGYEVNYAAADAYTRPSDLVAAQLAAATGVATVSAVPNGVGAAVSNKASKSQLATKPVVVLVDPAVARLSPASVGGLSAGRTASSKTTVGTTSMPTKVAFGLPSLSKSGVKTS